MAKKIPFKVVGLASSNGEGDVEVRVKAESPEAAKADALKKEPALAKHKDVRVYRQINQYVRVS